MSAGLVGPGSQAGQELGLWGCLGGLLLFGLWSWCVVVIAGASVMDQMIRFAISAGIHGVIAIHVRRAGLGSRLAA
jgi:hypothetical protein